MRLVGKTPIMGITPKNFTIDESLYYTDICPDCNYGIGVKASQNFKFYNDGKLLNVYECPLCKQLILRLFERQDYNPDMYKLITTYPNKRAITNFSDEINEISKNFVKIYNESEIAENNGLFEICGPGYRKALEFLIKDYIINKDPEKEKDVKGKFLGNCIKDYIEDERIKDTAERAAWIGNDETHYERKWETKDVQDLKEFIKLIVFWIESEIQYEKMLKDMPNKK